MITPEQKTQPLPSIPSLRASVLLPVMRYFSSQPEKFETLCQRRGLDITDISDPYAAVKLSTYLQIFEDAAHLDQSPFLGIELGRNINPGDFGPIGLLLLQSDSIFNGLLRFSQGCFSLQTATETSISTEGDTFCFNYHLLEPQLRYRFIQDSEFSMASLCQLIRIGFNARWKP